MQAIHRQLGDASPLLNTVARLLTMVGAIQNFIRRRERQLVASSGGVDRRDTSVPVVLAVDSQRLCDELALIVAVSGRELVSWDSGDSVPRDCREVTLLGSPERGPAATSEIEMQGVSVRLATVTDSPTYSGPQPFFLLPGEAPQLASYLGLGVQPDCVVLGSVGGAGTSVFASALAGVLADPAMGGDGQALLVDAEGRGCLDLILGLEDVPGLRLDVLGGSPIFPATRMSELPWAGDVGVLTGVGRPPEFLDPGCPIVRDCGRWRPEIRERSASRTILVVPATLPGVMAARSVLDTLPGVSVVLRVMTRAELSWNDAVTLLGHAPDATWEDDPFLSGDIDRGEFSPMGAAAGTAGTAAAHLVSALW